MSLPYYLSYLQAHPGYKNRTNIFFSQFFLEAADIPEYDIDTDELIYRGHNGNEVIRERFGIGEESMDIRQELRVSTGSSPM